MITLAQNKLARITGGCYLAFILASVLSDRLAHVGLSGPQRIYETMNTSVLSFRLGLAVVLLSALLFLVSAWGLYVLLRPVNRGLALLFLLLNVVGVAIQCASLLPLLSGLLMGDGAGRMQAFSAAQLEGLGYLWAGTYKAGFATAQLFFSVWLFPLGYLVYKSGTLPRFLGVLLLADGLGNLVWFFQALVAPNHHGIIYPGMVVSFLAEFGLSVWLLARGIKVLEPAGTVLAEPSSAS
jgi:hypothetical protein